MSQSKENRQTGALWGPHRVGSIPEDVTCPVSCQQLRDHRVSQQGHLLAPAPACVLASSHCQLLHHSLPCWEKLRISGQSLKWFFFGLSVSSHLLDHRFHSPPFWLQISAQPPGQLSQCVLCSTVATRPQTLWLQSLRSHTLPEVISHSIFVCFPEVTRPELSSTFW